ncbi:MAG: winged helix-turn-helix domain-containing protein [Candidatus Bathyarchaeia archaeon]
MRTEGQKQTWKTNDTTIKQALAKQNLTFKELIEKTGLSRAVVNQHLKELVKTEKVVKRFWDGKVVNVLTDDARRELGPLYQTNFAKEISMVLEKVDANFKETLNPEGFFSVMNYYLDLNLLTIIPMIRSADKLAIENEKLKKVDSDIFKELTDSIITLYVSDVAKAFAQDFLRIVLKYGKELDVDKLAKELAVRMKQAKGTCTLAG